MSHTVTITTPMPTLDELGKELGLTKAEQDFLIRLVDEKGLARTAPMVGNRRGISSKAHNHPEQNGTNAARKKNDRAIEASA
jgi:hypothetical protein